MRVIAGKAKRIRLTTIEGVDTRPTTDRIKETLFNMLNPSLYDCSFLDLFSGSGGIGIEALSRGAKRGVFIESNKEACACIEKNLVATRLQEDAILMNIEVIEGLKSLEAQTLSFDFIFMDPPYNQGLEQKVLDYLKDSSLIHMDTQIIIESSRETDFSYLESYGFLLQKSKVYKNNQHIFLTKGE